MRVYRSFLLLTALTLLVCAFQAAAFAEIKMPTWPQTFSIENGESFSIGVPVTQPGTITVSLTWQGGPLTAVLKDSTGKPLVNPTRLPGTSAEVDYAIKEADLQRGTLWIVSLSGPQRAKITGQITMTFPEIDMVKAETATRSLVRPTTKRNETQIAASNLRAIQAFTQKQVAFVKARETDLAAMSAVTQSFVTALPKQPVGISKTDLGSLRIPAPATKAGAKTPVALADFDITTLQFAPASLSSVSPTTGKPGTTVVLTGRNLLPDQFFNTAGASISTYWTGAMFKIAQNVEKPAKLLNARKNADGTISMDAAVPNTVGLVDVYNGTVCLYDSSVKTNTVSFRFQPSGLPTITSAAPSILGPGDRLAIQGNFFSRDDKAYIDMGNGDVEIPISYYSDKKVWVDIPTYTSKTTTSRRLYIMHQFSYGWNGGAPYWVKLFPTEVTINAVNYVSGPTMISTNPQGQPGDPIVITGAGFSNPKVHFIVSEGIDKVGNIESSDDGTIRTSVPDVTGVPGDYAGSVYVIGDNNRKSNVVNFTFHPTMDYQMIDLYLLRPDKGLDEISFSKKTEGDYFSLDEELNPDYSTNPNKYVAHKLNGRHFAELCWGFKGDDLFYLTKRLNNNWKVSYIDLTFESGGARLDDYSPGTDSPYAKVHWWVEACSYVDYYISWHIQGPKGTSYYY
jgi:hypothetical protein